VIGFERLDGWLGLVGHGKQVDVYLLGFELGVAEDGLLAYFLKPNCFFPQ